MIFVKTIFFWNTFYSYDPKKIMSRAKSGLVGCFSHKQFFTFIPFLESSLNEIGRKKIKNKKAKKTFLHTNIYCLNWKPTGNTFSQKTFQIWLKQLLKKVFFMESLQQIEKSRRLRNKDDPEPKYRNSTFSDFFRKLFVTNGFFKSCF